MGWIEKNLGVRGLRLSISRLNKRVTNLEKSSNKIHQLTRKSAVLEKRIIRLEKLSKRRFKTKVETIKENEREVLGVLKGKMTTTEIAKKLKASRTWVSLLLNKLEREKKVKEVGKKGRSVLYEKL